MSEPFYYRLKTTPKKNKDKKVGRSNFLGRLDHKSKKKLNLFVSVVGVYVVLAGLIGMVMFNISRDPAQADEAAAVSASLKILNDKEQYSLGDPIETKITLQNTSLSEPINNLNLEMRSTKDSIKWSQMEIVAGRNREQVVESEGNIFKLPVLTPGERVEYLVTGTLEGNEVDYVTILGEMKFINIDGSQEAFTNKVFTPINNINGSQDNLLELTTEKESYEPSTEVLFNLNIKKTEGSPVFPQTNGKIYISKKNSKDLVSTIDCELNESGFCMNKVTSLEPGDYSSLFISEDESIYSQIHQFTVVGSTESFTPSAAASLEFPFGSVSENGIVPVIAERVVSQNDSPNGKECVFEIIQGEEVVATAAAPVESERICYTNIATAQIPTGEGIYRVKLAGTSLEREVSFLNKPSNLINLENKSPVLKLGQDVYVEANEIVDSREQVESDQSEEESTEETEEESTDEDGAEETVEQETPTTMTAELGIWHPRSGEYKTISAVNGSPLQVVNGQFKANLSSEFFSKGGFYRIFLKLEDGQYSDFLGLSFDGNETGFSGSGVKVEDYNTLKVGQSPVFILQNITDRSGNVISEGGCAANVYQRDINATPVLLKGEIKNGECKVVLGQDEVKKSGPVLVTFSGEGIENNINQARQFEFLPGTPEDYGEINLEFYPARKDFANNLLIGPVVDSKANLTNSYGHKVQIINSEEEAVEYPLEIVNGYGKIELPSIIFDKGNLKVVFLNINNEVIMEREIEVTEEKGKLIIPNFPDEIESDKSIQLGISGLDLSTEEQTNCTLRVYQTKEQYAEETTPYSPERDGCEFDWPLNEFRDQSQLLLRLQAGERVYYHISRQKSGEPASIFAVSPSVKINSRNEAEIELLSSPIVDRNGLTVERSNMRFQYNGKIEEIEIKNGFIKLPVTADKVNSGDIRNILDQRFLDIGLEAKASVSSISKTNDFSIYLGTNDIAGEVGNFAIEKASTHIRSGTSEVFSFKAESCNAVAISNRGLNPGIRTHWQAGTCYVQVQGEPDKYSLIFEDNGFTIGKFDFRAENQKQDVIWCKEKPCAIQVIGALEGEIQAVVYDGENVYRYESSDIESVINIQQNGLNPLKEYLVEVTYEDVEGNRISFYNEISGEYLAE
jgi:hypothetical protein